jgi:hypothetical protein
MSTRIALAALTLCLLPMVARADSFVILPNGELAFVLNASTQVSFTCRPGVPCSAAANSVTLGTGADTTTFTFSGSVINTLVGAESVPVLLATVQTAITGAGYVNAENFGGIQSPLGTLSIGFTQTSPAPAVSGINALLAGGPDSYRLLFGQAAGANSTYFITPTGPNPPGFNYGNLAFEMITDPSNGAVNLPVGATREVTARAGAIPEPATLLLFATGLAGAAGKARGRRKG